MISFGYVLPPFVEYCSFTLAMEPVRFHVMLRDSSTTHVSPPSGTVRFSLPLTMKLPSEASLTSESFSAVIFTRRSVSMASGIVHAYVSAPEAIEAITLFGYVLPPSVE